MTGASKEGEGIEDSLQNMQTMDIEHGDKVVPKEQYSKQIDTLQRHSKNFAWYDILPKLECSRTISCKKDVQNDNLQKGCSGL